MLLMCVWISVYIVSYILVSTQAVHIITDTSCIPYMQHDQTHNAFESSNVLSAIDLSQQLFYKYIFSNKVYMLIYNSQFSWNVFETWEQFGVYVWRYQLTSELKAYM